MASDQKRQNVGSKAPVATPNVGPSGLVPLETALSSSIGARVRITLAAPASSVLEGMLFTTDPTTNLVAINTSTPPPTPASTSTTQTGDYNIIPISRIQNFQILSLAPSESQSFTTAVPSIHQLDMKALKRREEAAVRKLQEKEMRRGKGVSKEGQDIFDALSKTMPCTWDGTSIVVAEVVVIDKPYRTDDCRSVDGSADSPAVARIKRTLDMEKMKLSLRHSSTKLQNTRTAIPNNLSHAGNVASPRKGG